MSAALVNPPMWQQRETIHVDAVTALLGERAAQLKGDEPARLILQTADHCDALHAHVVVGARQIAKAYQVFADGFAGEDRRCRPPIEGISAPEVTRHTVEYESHLMALQSLVRAVLGIDLRLPAHPAPGALTAGGVR